MSREKTQTEATQRLIDTNLVYTRTITVGKVTRILTHGWVEVEPQIQMVAYDPQTEEETPVDLGPLLRVPIGFYKAGGMIMSLPLDVGDEGVILVSDRSLDLWKETGKKAMAPLAALHDLTNAIFVPWPTSQPGAIQGYNTGAMVMGKEDGSAVVSVARNGNISLTSGTRIQCTAPIFAVQSDDIQLSGANMTVNNTTEFTETVKAPDIDFGNDLLFTTHRHNQTGTGGGTATDGPIAGTQTP